MKIIGYPPFFLQHVGAISFATNFCGILPLSFVAFYH